jgi:hypothetical protein
VHLIANDESTHTKNIAEFALFIRRVNGDFHLVERLLFRPGPYGRITGAGEMFSP